MADPLAVLVDAVSRGDVEAASAILVTDPALARQEQGGATPLHYAAVHGQTSAVDLLIDHGADLEALDQEYGAAPIGWANEKGYMDLVRHMRARGARVSLHMAAAFGVPSVVIFGPSDPAIWGPWRTTGEVVAMDSGVNEVLGALQRWRVPA